MTAALGLPAGKSVLERWKEPDGTFKYRELCPVKNGESFASQPDCKLFAVLMAELFRLDAARPVKENYETDLLRTDGRPLAFFNDKIGYSRLGMFIWTDFWLRGSNFGQLSKVLRASDRPTIDDVAGASFIVYATS
jgi:hypothetical protein